MDIYNFSATTGEFLGSQRVAMFIDEDTPLMPRNSTKIAPPEAGEGEVAVWEYDAWSVQVDNRGSVYWLDDGTRHVITEIGDELPANALDEAPPPPLEDQKAAALEMARGIAADIRREVAVADPRRINGWVQKYVMAVLSDLHISLAAAQVDAPTLASVAQVTQLGFAQEATLTGELAPDLIERTIARGNALFLANQIVEGMERRAERDIPAAETQAALDAPIADLRQAEADAMVQLQHLTEGGSHA